MEAIQNRSITIPRQAAARTFLWALLFLSFFVYPLAIFPPTLKIGQTVFFNLPHTISLPGVIILGLLGIPVMLFFRWSLNRLLLTAVIVFFLMLVWNVPQELEYLDEFLELISYITIPIAAAILLKSGHLTLNKIAVWASALWLVQILLGTIAWFCQTEPMGTPGNINWMAGLLLMLSPWVIWFFIQTAQSRKKDKRVAVALALLVWFVPTTFILYHCHSRSAWLAVCLLPLLLCIIKLRRPIHKILFASMLMIGGFAFLVAAYVWFPAPLLSIVETDVRVPLWTGTGVMMTKHPLGVGSGEYQKHFTPLRRVSSYQTRLYAADMTVHPHNELLNIGTQLGLPALLAFLIMISTIGRSVSKDPLQICARISGYFVVMLSLFDMFLVQVPTSFLGLFILGLCWPIEVHSTKPLAQTPDRLFIPKTILSGLLAAWALIVCYMDVTHDIHRRHGEIKEHLAKKYMDLNLQDEARKSLQEAIAIYKESIIPFNSIIPFYKIGNLSLKLPDNTDQAEAYLNRVAAIDPNFSHLNLLFGQLNLQRRDLAAAEHFFARECDFYPRSERAWQNMYTFATATGQYNRSIAINTTLGDIYRERARKNLGANRLAAKQTSFVKTLHDADPAEAMEAAKEFVDRINYNFTDPLFFQITMGQTWPPFFFSGGFNVLDAATWRLRKAMFSTLQKELGPLPISPEALVSWYSKFIQIEDTESLTLPLGVWNRRSGNPLSVYLLFSILCELNQSPLVICLDTTGRPAYGYLFVKKATEIRIFRVNLLAPDCKSITRTAFKNNFRWIPGKTMAFYPMADFFLRNQILGSLVQADLPYLPQHPPSRRLLELFAMTESQPPPFSTLKDYCFKEHIQQQYNSVRQKTSISAK